MEFYYWYKKQLGIYLYKRAYKDKKDVMISIWEYHKIKDYDEEWYSSWWKNFIVWKNYKGKGVSN
jgi:hypothetical protein